MNLAMLFASSRDTDDLVQQQDIARSIISKNRPGNDATLYGLVTNSPNAPKSFPFGKIRDEKELFQIVSSLSHKSEVTNVNEALSLAIDLFTKTKRQADQNMLAVFITNTSVNTMTSADLKLLEKSIATKDPSIVFIVSGTLSQGTEEGLVKVLGDRNKIMYIDGDTKVDGNAVNNLMLKGILYDRIKYFIYKRFYSSKSYGAE